MRGEAWDCRIGDDTDLGPYDVGGMPWLLTPKGNVFACPVPACITSGVCNSAHASPVPSPVRCRNDALPIPHGDIRSLLR